MPHDPRPRRVAPIGARVQLAHTVTDVVDVSGTGVLIRVGYKLRPGSEWPLVLELPSAAPVQVTGRVVRCEPIAVSLPAGAVLAGHYLLALRFVDPSTEAQAVLAQVCGTSVEPPERPG
ncbi:MAG: PilZ domain-containing protein [Acidobacteria bacterium]|nr:PilZ domain-containing protein [Acidobacteriota bacterium]